MAAPDIGFLHGGAVVAAGRALVVLLLQAGAAWAVLPATAGFFLVAPRPGAGLHETNRRRERGEDISPPLASGAFRRNGPQLAMMGAALRLIHPFRVRVAGLIFAVFWCPASSASPSCCR